MQTPNLRVVPHVHRRRALRSLPAHAGQLAGRVAIGHEPRPGCDGASRAPALPPLAPWARASRREDAPRSPVAPTAALVRLLARLPGVRPVPVQHLAALRMNVLVAVRAPRARAGVRLHEEVCLLIACPPHSCSRAFAHATRRRAFFAFSRALLFSALTRSQFMNRITHALGVRPIFAPASTYVRPSRRSR